MPFNEVLLMELQQNYIEENQDDIVLVNETIVEAKIQNFINKTFEKYKVSKKTILEAIEKYGLEGVIEIRDYALAMNVKSKKNDFSAYLGDCFRNGHGLKTQEEREAELKKMEKQKQRKLEAKRKELIKQKQEKAAAKEKKIFDEKVDAKIIELKKSPQKWQQLINEAKEKAKKRIAQPKNSLKELTEAAESKLNELSKEEQTKIRKLAEKHKDILDFVKSVGEDFKKTPGYESSIKTKMLMIVREKYKLKSQSIKNYDKRLQKEAERIIKSSVVPEMVRQEGTLEKV